MGGKNEGLETAGSDLAKIYYLEKEYQTWEKKIKEAEEVFGQMQDELCLVKQQKENVDVQIVQIRNVMKHMENDVNALRKEAGELKEQKCSLEEQCTALSARSEQTLTELNEKSKELQDKNSSLEEANSRLEEAKGQLERIGSQQDLVKRVKKKYPIVAAFGIAAVFLILCIYFGNQISDRNRLYQDAMGNLLFIERNAPSAVVKVNSVYNSGEGEKKSDDLNASEMRYLMFDFNLYCLKDASDFDFPKLKSEERTVYIDIYNPDGRLRLSFDSPEGHTFVWEVDTYGHAVTGWGNAESSSYDPGTYRVDFIYMDEIVHSQKVVIE